VGEGGSTMTDTGARAAGVTEEWLAAAVVKESAEAIVVTDPAGLIRLWNDGAARVFGYSADEAMGQNLDVIIPEKLRERHWKGYFQTMATGYTRYGDKMLSVPAHPPRRAAAVDRVQCGAAARRRRPDRRDIGDHA
jgi:PAS domain S-box-containing protein